MIFADTINITPVDVPTLRRDPFALALLRGLESRGFAQAVLHGGALRDRFMGRARAISDLDIWVNFGSAAGDRAPDMVTPGYFAAVIQELWPEAEIISAPPLSHTSSRSQSWGRMTLQYKGRHIDLHMTTVPYDLGAKALAADAPLNAVAMDASGTVRAHPLFASHAQGRIYAPLPCIEGQVAQERFEHLRRKIPGLQMPQATTGATVIPFAPRGPQPL
ncbi:MAG: hypothetical protein KJ667_07740 [Alphaproteobacteria bacterium]|nr:hypothetical protein [Alphaproteobacteria bacterium]